LIFIRTFLQTRSYVSPITRSAQEEGFFLRNKPQAWTLALTLTQCQGSHIPKVMPTYEYACGACGHQWDEVQRITEPPLEVCPKCAKSAAHRLISGGTNFILKGGGWYSDLYASPKAAASKKDESSKNEESTAKQESTAATGDGKAKPEAKPAATATAPAAPATPPASPST
jgi:putative FmdB family regulatory protein